MMKPAELLALTRTTEAFVVRDYTAAQESENPDEAPVVAVVPADALFEIIEDAHQHKKLITISPVGPPIIDWRT